MYENNHHKPSGAPPSSGQSPPDSPEPVQSAGKRLQRSEDQRILLGVCGGLANYFDFDPTIVRIAFVLLAVFGGSGLLLYIAFAIIMPSHDQLEAHPRQAARATVDEAVATTRDAVDRATGWVQQKAGRGSNR